MVGPSCVSRARSAIRPNHREGNQSEVDEAGRLGKERVSKRRRTRGPDRRRRVDHSLGCGTAAPSLAGSSTAQRLALACAGGGPDWTPIDTLRSVLTREADGGGSNLCWTTKRAKCRGGPHRRPCTTGRQAGGSLVPRKRRRARLGNGDQPCETDVPTEYRIIPFVAETYPSCNHP